MLAKSPTPRALAKAATRQRVLEAARLSFATKGYEASTIRDIAKLAGMSTGAVFASFEGKAALYREVHGFPPISPEVGAKLRGALKALIPTNLGDVPPAVPDSTVLPCDVTVREIRAARAALALAGGV